MRFSVIRTLGPAMLTVPTATPPAFERMAAAIAVTPGSASLTAKPYPRLAVVLISRSNASIDRIAFGPYLSTSSEAAVPENVLDRVVGRQRREPRLSACGGEERNRPRRLGRLIDEAAGRSLRVREPHERVAVDDGEPRELAALVRETVEQRLADVRDARCRVEPLSQHREPHRQSIEPRIAVLLGPAQLDERRQQPVRAALRKGEPFGNLAQRQLARAIGEELDDRQTTFGGHVGHAYQEVRCGDVVGPDADPKKSRIASTCPDSMSRPVTCAHP